jgi:hypothetical protein
MISTLAELKHIEEDRHGTSCQHVLGIKALHKSRRDSKTG